MNELNSTDTAARDFVSAVICTCNRGDTVLLALRSLLACKYTAFEILLIDQSADDRTQTAVQPYLCDPRVRYIRSETKGLGRSHNIAIREARSDILIITDDDCEVPPDWLDKMASVFHRFPNVAVAYCNVDAGPHDAEAGFIPSYRCAPPRMLTRPGEAPGGIGAGMAVRKSHVLALGGFDDRLGPGAPFPSGDEQDLSARALLRGYHVCLTDETSIVHYGFRTWEEGKQLTRRDCRAAGAVSGKLFRSGHHAMVLAPFRVLWLFGLLLWEDAKRFRRPRGMGRITSFLRGFSRDSARRSIEPHCASRNPTRYPRRDTARREGLGMPGVIARAASRLRRAIGRAAWLAAQHRAGHRIYSSLEITGLLPPYPRIQLAGRCCIERDVTLWLSPDPGADAKLRVGAEVFIGRNCYLGIYQPIEIGTYAIIGAYSYIISANHCYASRDVPIKHQGFIGASISIGEDVWLGTRVTVLPGVTIGKGAIVAGGSVVNRDVPPYEVWGGMPARFLKARP